MNPERWARVKELFHAALACEPERREAFLLEAAGDDASLRETVASMLARQPDASRFLEVPALEAAAMAMAAELGAHEAERTFGAAGVAAAKLEAAGAGSAGREVTPQPPADLPVRRRPASTRPPWWMVLLAAIFLADALLRAWGHVVGPEGFRFAAEPRGGRYVVTAVTAGSLAEEAGIRPGDVIVARDHQPYDRVSDPRVTQPNLVAGRTYHFEVERDGERFDVAIAMRRSPAIGKLYWEATLLWQVAMFAMLATAFLVAFARPRDPMARLGALTLAALGVSFYVFNLPPRGMRPRAAACRGASARSCSSRTSPSPWWGPSA